MCIYFQLNIKLGRALRPGEYRVKVYQLLVNDPEVNKIIPTRKDIFIIVTYVAISVHEIYDNFLTTCKYFKTSLYYFSQFSSH